MNKLELALRVAAVTKLDSEHVLAVIRTLFDGDHGVIIDSLREGETISLQGFGVFSVLERAGRTVSHPVTGMKTTVPAKRSIKFRPSKNLRNIREV